jgi:hypothetical protein
VEKKLICDDSLICELANKPILASPLITSPANALPASRIREYDFINGLDGDVGLDRTPPGVWSPVAHPSVDDLSLLDGVMRKPAAMTLHKTT